MSAGRLYRRGGIWWGRLRRAGREFARSLRTRDRAEAKRRLAEWSKSFERAQAAGLARLSWEDAVTVYTDVIMPRAVKPATAERYKVSFRQVGPFLEGKYVDEITAGVLADMVEKRQRANISNATINRDLTAISRVIATAKARGGATTNPARDFERSLLTRERREPIRPPSSEDVDKLVARAPGMFAALIRFLSREGTRQEETASLEWPHIDLAAGTATMLNTKGSYARTITLSAETIAELRTLPRHLKSKAIFWHGNGQRYLNVASRFAQLTAELGLTFRCHDLRHAYAIDRLRRTRDIYGLSKHLGHKSVKTTEIYLGYLSVESAAGVQSGVQSGA